MNAIQAHRGPDDAGTWHDAGNGVGFAHRRLSIIDLSPQGHQPMWDVSRRAVICFNGEIYNYRELRAELEAAGATFASASDTEVILNLYLKYGDACLARLNGIFALAIWDLEKRRLLLARDGFGVKPLYYTRTPKGVLFASELKALLMTPEVDRSLDPEAISHLLAYLYCPAPRTPLRAVRKLLPGHGLVLEAGKEPREWAFYRLPFDQKIRDWTEAEAAEELRRLLDQAVRRQMIADVPVGAFLSGGLDSSSIAVFAQNHLQGRRLQCFTIAMDAAALDAEGYVADTPYAERVAKHLGVDLHTVKVAPPGPDEVERMVFHLDEPTPDPAAINTRFICKLARELGVKVLLSGAGGDDLFTGYRRHVAVQAEQAWAWMPVFMRAGLRRATQCLPQGHPLGRRVSKAFRYADQDEARRLAGYFLWIDPKVLRPLYGPQIREGLRNADPMAPMLEALQELPSGQPAINRMLYLDQRFFLGDHNLNYGDKMSMAVGVEARVPFLDPDLAAFAATLPVGLKQRGKIGKWIFKRAMEPHLPHDVIYRPKAGFGLPLRSWMHREIRPLVQDLLAPATLKARGLFDAEAVDALRSQDERGIVDASYPLFGMICLELWCRRFLDSKDIRPVGLDAPGR